MTTPDRPRISLLGTTAILFEAPGTFDLPHQRRIWALAATASKWPGIREAIPGITNLMLTFETPPRARRLPRLGTQRRMGRRRGTCDRRPRDRAAGDLWRRNRIASLQTVADHTAACPSMTSCRFMPRRSTPCSRSAAIPAIAISAAWTRESAMPRRQTPLQRSAGGSVSIGGSQTGVSASPGPSGWHAIGHTTWTFFDPSWPTPAALAPGDTIRFKIDRVIR